MEWFIRLIWDESAASAVEYGLLIGVIAVVIMNFIGMFGAATNAVFQRIIDTLSSVK